jgi:hypothetical protein
VSGDARAFDSSAQPVRGFFRVNAMGRRKTISLFGTLIVAWLSFTTIGMAASDCMTSCMAGKGCGLQYESGRVESGYCSIAQSDCEVQCRHGEKSASTYGAIAFSPSSGAWGDGSKYGHRAEAERRALAECAKSARDCTVAVWFNDQCGAVAIAEAGIWAGGLGHTQAAAGNAALADCAKRGGKKCKVQEVLCSR